MSPRIQRRFPPTADSLAAVRQLAGEVVPALGERDRFSVELLLSELFTNAVRHSSAAPGDDIEVAIERTDDRLRIEVRDGGDGFTVRPRTPDRHRGSGWGLHFVSTMALRWGVEADDGTRVWLELGLADDAALTDQRPLRAAASPPGPSPPCGAPEDGGSPAGA